VIFKNPKTQAKKIESRRKKKQYCVLLTGWSFIGQSVESAKKQYPEKADDLHKKKDRDRDVHF
jgi:hypothetical protein